MGTPVPLRSREEQCVGANPKVDTMQLTEEERKYYDSIRKQKKKAVFILPEDERLYITERKSEEMGARIERPSKEKMEEMCKQYLSRNKAAYGIARELDVSHGTIDNWIKEYKLEWIWKGVLPQENRSSGPDSSEQNKSEVKEKSPEDEALEHAEAAETHYLFTEDKSEIRATNQPVQESGTEVPVGTGYFPPVKIEFIGDPNEPNEDTLAVQPGNGQLHHPETAIGPEDDLILTNQMYKFGEYAFDVQYDNQVIVISDIVNLTEILIPFARVKSFVRNMKKVETELFERQEK